MLVSLCGNAFAKPVKLAAADAEDQLYLIFSGLSVCRQDEKEKVWSYAVTDLDRNGRLELLAAFQDDETRATTLKAWEIDEKEKALTECRIDVEENESFPDMITDSADTFYDEKADSWSYLIYDNVPYDQDNATFKCLVTMKNGSIGFTQVAVQHEQTVSGQNYLFYTDMDGHTIPQDAYDTAGVDAFPDKDRSSTAFDWFTFKEASMARLTDSYSIFTGEKKPPKPAPTSTPAPAASPLTITKNPTDEYHKEGETALFIADASSWTSLTWTAVAPDGYEYPMGTFQSFYQYCGVGGADTSSLYIANVSANMNGYGFYCTFHNNNGQTARSSTARLYVDRTPQPVPPGPSPTNPPVGMVSGTVIDALMSTVTIALDSGGQVQPLKDVCTVDGELNIGCRCDVYYSGNYPSNDTITYVYIYGTAPTPPTPTYGQMDGTVVDALMSTVTISLDYAGTVQVLKDIVNVMYGSLSIGCRCTVYYTDSPTADNIYSVDVYGSDDADEPEDSSDDWNNVGDFVLGP
jgi:hypothetical protein